MFDKFGYILVRIAPLSGFIIMGATLFTSWWNFYWMFVVVGTLGVALIAIQESVSDNQEQPTEAKFHPLNSFALAINFGLAMIAESTALSGIFCVMGAICFLFWLRDRLKFFRLVDKRDNSDVRTSL